MASSQRNPRDLRQLVEASHKDVNDMQTNLEKLRNLSSDDKTENAMLRSRIDEQSELIMILKSRADEHLIRSQTLDKLNSELEKSLEDGSQNLQLEVQKVKMLDERFHMLAGNHEDMIAIKDQYKKTNKLLCIENSRLKADNENLFSKTIADKNAKIDKLEVTIGRLQTLYQDMDLKYRNLEDEYKLSKSSFEQRIKHQRESYDKQISSLEYRLKNAETELKSACEKLEFEISKRASTDEKSIQNLEVLSKEKEDLLQLCMNRGKLIQEKQVDNKKLQSKIDEMEKLVREMELKFEREVDSVNSNVAVRRMKQDLEEANRKHTDAMKEFDAYKKHTGALLQKERDLNAKLRHLMV